VVESGTTADPGWLVDQVARSQGRLDAALQTLTEPQVRGPSALPGWARAHVLAHLAGNATAMAEMFEGYARGEEVQQYAGSPDRREAEIDTVSTRPADQLIDLVRDTGARCLAAYRVMPDWSGSLRWRSGRWPVTRGPVSRWREIEIHRLDLDLGYTPSDWPAQFVAFNLEREMARLPERAPGVQAPAHPATTVLAWLFGRGDRGLPPLPAWG